MVVELVPVSMFMPLLLLMRFNLWLTHNHESILNQFTNLFALEVSHLGKFLL
jgi:hypothetical protein